MTNVERARRLGATARHHEKMATILRRNGQGESAKQADEAAEVARKEQNRCYNEAR